MFDIGFLELLVIFVLGLVVIGPERLPSTIKTCAIWFSRFKRSIQEARAEFEQQIGADEIRREIHNERVMESMRKFEEQRAELENKVNDFKSEVEAAAQTEDTVKPTETKSHSHNTDANHAHDCKHGSHDNEEPEASEPKPHAPMVQDETGADVSELPGRSKVNNNKTAEETKEKHGKQ